MGRKITAVLSHVVSEAARDDVLFGWKNVPDYVSEIDCGNIGAQNGECRCSQGFEEERHMGEALKASPTLT